MAFGSGMGESLFGSRAGNVLTRMTVTLAAVFMATTIVLGILFAHGRAGGRTGSVMDKADSVPMAPAAAPTAAPQPAAPMMAPEMPAAPSTEASAPMMLQMGEGGELAPAEIAVPAEEPAPAMEEIPAASEPSTEGEPAP